MKDRKEAMRKLVAVDRNPPGPLETVEDALGEQLDGLPAAWELVPDANGKGGHANGRGRSPRNAMAALLAIADALEASRPAPRELAMWLATALRTFLATEGSSLEELLALKPRPGGAFETVWQLQRRACRDRLLEDLASVLDGPIWACSKRIAGLLAAARAGRPIDAPEVAKVLVARLLDECSDITPASDRQISRILKGECISKRRL